MRLEVVQEINDMLIQIYTNHFARFFSDNKYIYIYSNVNKFIIVQIK